MNNDNELESLLRAYETSTAQPLHEQATVNNTQAEALQNTPPISAARPKASNTVSAHTFKNYLIAGLTAGLLCTAAQAYVSYRTLLVHKARLERIELQQQAVKDNGIGYTVQSLEARADIVESTLRSIEYWRQSVDETLTNLAVESGSPSPSEGEYGNQ